MKPTILLTGKTGQIGSQLHRLLPSFGNVAAPDRNELDLSNSDAICRLVRDLQPHLIVNAAAYTAVDAAENDEARAYAINAEAPALLAEEAGKLGALLVHYSTDYVFDGLKRTPYDEKDPPNPLNVYGKSKLAGEEAIRSSGGAHLLFRTAWVYATQGRNFLLTILRLATEREELEIVQDQVGAPTCANDIAKATIKVLTNILGASSDIRRVSEVRGTYHMTAAGETSWYEFTKAILEKASSTPFDLPWFAAATKGRQLIARRVVPISAAAFRSSTRRPSYSVLSNSRLAQTFNTRLPDWRSQLHHCFTPENTDRHSLA